MVELTHEPPSLKYSFDASNTIFFSNQCFRKIIGTANKEVFDEGNCIHSVLARDLVSFYK